MKRRVFILKAILLSLFLTMLAFNANAQKVTLSFQKETLEKVLNSIKQQTALSVIFSEQVVDLNRKVSINVKSIQVEDALKQLLAGTTVSYEIKNNKLYLIEKKSVEINASQGKLKKVSGLITDIKGEPIIGASVKVNGSKSGIISDVNGRFSLEVAEQSTITVSYIGYLTTTIKVGHSDKITITLSEDATALNDVVVIGYQNQLRKDVTNAISSVKVDKIDQGAGYDPIKILQGRATGISITSPSGTPGSSPIVTIRGVSSISSGSEPLYVVDGVPSGTGYPNLNPNDIATIDVLKDASSTAIYGSRANAGVIIITTKQGKEGKTKIEVSGHYGTGSIYNDIRMANSAQYTAVMQDAVKNYNTQMGTALSLYVPSTIQETNWVNEISRQSAQNYVFNMSMSGGNQTTNFFTSFGAYTQEGILKNSDYKQYNYRLNLNHTINPMLVLHASLSGSYSPQDKLEESSTSLKLLFTAREEQPWYSPYNADGTYKVNGKNDIIRHNPVMLSNEEKWTNQAYDGIGRVSVDFTPIKGLTYTPSLSAYAYYTYDHKFLTDQMVARSTTAGWGAVQINTATMLRYVFDNVISYKNNIGKLNYNALVGHSFESYTNNKFGAYSDNYTNNAYPSSGIDDISAGAAIYPATNGFDAYALDSYFGRLTFDYDNRYLINASVRADGTSKFPKDNRYGTFPAISFGWNAMNEQFMQKSFFSSIFTNLKLRVGYGMTGSFQGIGSFDNQSLVKGGYSYNGAGGLALNNIGQEITWEKAGQYNVGMDADFLKGRISLVVDYFNKKTDGMLFQLPIQATSGYTTKAANIGTMQNDGLELALNAKILTGEFKWEAGANISFVNNKLLSLYSGQSMYILPGSGSTLLGGGVGIHALIDGEPVGAYYLKKQIGIYQSDSDVPSKLFAKGVRAGDIIYEDVNKDGDITDADRQYVGKATPDFFGGFNTSFSYKGFELGIFGQYSVGGKIYASWKGGGSEGIENLGNLYSNATLDDGSSVEQFFGVSEYAATHYWTGPGTSNFMPRAVRKGVWTGYTYGYNWEPSTHFLEDASYIRIKTVTLSYSLPEKTLKPLKLSSVKVFATVDNLLTLTKYDGYDPEQSYSTSPGDANYGVDFGMQSSLRTISFGANIKF